ncbi:MAG: hypothetical protein EXR70_02325 [Deltaproteobacteria bacterium]|nr:hypothetical protein [Deltaproteobacteria bacterium]
MANKPLISPPEATLHSLTDWLKAENVPGLIIGGVAASLLGRPRFTQDVDALISLDEKHWERFLSAGTQFGFTPRISDAADFARKARVFLVQHQPTGIHVDIALAGLPFEEEAIQQVKLRRIGKLILPLPTPENLIIMKAIAHRPQDMADIGALADANPKLDHRRIHRWVREFSRALDMPDILTDLEKILSDTRKRKPR